MKLYGPTLLAILALAGCRQAAEAPAPDTTAAAAAGVKEAEDFRAAHEKSYRENWSTIAGLHFISEGAHTAGSAATNKIVLPPSVPPVIGRFVLNGEKVRFEPQRGVSVMLRDQPVTAAIELKDDGEDEADELTIGDVRMVVHRSGVRKTIRVWDPNGEQAKNFLGFQWFPIQAEYRVAAKYIPDAMARQVPVVNTFGDTDLYDTDGVVEFTLNGETLRLRPFKTAPKRLYFVFRDGSSGQETYEAARFLYADLQDDGTTVLDFNQAYNPPCAFNPYTTCPIPIPENRLTAKILAGEKAYPVH